MKKLLIFCVYIVYGFWSIIIISCVYELIKRLFFSFLLLILTVTVQAQSIDTVSLNNHLRSKNYISKVVASSFFAAVSGAFHRTAEIAKDDYRRIKEVHPNWDEQWANPKKSFKNKYKDWPRDQSPAYFGSTTILVSTTDMFHLYNTLSSISMATSIGFTLTLHEKIKLRQVLFECMRTFLFYNFGRAMADFIYPKID